MKPKAEITGHIRILDASPDLVDRFTDRLMDALENDTAVHHPRMSGSLASGELSVHFSVYVETGHEIDGIGPKHLHDAIRCAGATQVHDWTESPDNKAEGDFDDVRDLVESHPAMVRTVTCQLADA